LASTEKKLKLILILVGAIFAILLLGWLGLKIKPKPFPAFPGATPRLEMVPLPAGLPVPVERFYRQTSHQAGGERVPLIDSAVVTGRARMRIKGVTFPARFRFTHLAGQGYRHYIEVTFFGLPLMKVNERYLEGKSLFELPFDTLDNDPNINQGANLGVWAESVWLPSVWITDHRVRWEPVDEVTALLVVPFQETEERFVVRFDPDTGMLRYMEAMRYRDPGDEAKILWIAESAEWGSLDGFVLPRVGPVTWFDQGTPWAIFSVEDVVYNADVGDYIRAKGP
jgi:hypothetical protein